MAREEHDDPEDARTTRPPRRNATGTDRLTPGDPGYARASERNWRGDRPGRSRRSFSFPSSRQEFALWLQYGGLRIVTIVAGIAFVVILGLFLWRGVNRSALRSPTPTPVSSAFNQPLLQPLATVTPVMTPTAVIASQGTGGSGGAQFRVVNTGPDGLFLRPDHTTDSQPIKTLPEGAIVTIIGEDFSGPDRVWKHVRDSEGTEGWAASDFLKPAQ